ncbi:MAG: integration host factor subunit beta [Bacteroidetes bacterium]|nr:integration host factor subunit beta [Bacteroidota bacterium]
MTKAEIVNEIASTTGIDKPAVLVIVEATMENIRANMAKGENIYLRGFGTFQLKKRAEKTGRNITKNTSVKIPAHMIPAFKPSKEFVAAVKTNVKVK